METEGGDGWGRPRSRTPSYNAHISGEHEIPSGHELGENDARSLDGRDLSLENAEEVRETPAEIMRQLEDIFEEADGIQETRGDDLNRVFTLKDPADNTVFFKSSVTTNGAGSTASKTMRLELDMAYLSKPDKQHLLDKVKAYTKNKKFIVKSCASPEHAKRLIDEFGVENLKFDDTNRTIKSFKDELLATYPNAIFFDPNKPKNGLRY